MGSKIRRNTMNPSLKSKLRLSLFLILMPILFIMTYGFFNTGSLNVKINQIHSIESTIVRLDGIELKLEKTNPFEYSIDTKPGKHDLEIISSGYKKIVQEVRMGIKENKKLEFNLETLTNVDIEAELNSLTDNPDSPDIKNFNFSLFGNNTWAIFSRGSEQANSDYIIVVAVINPVTGRWEVVVEGSDIVASDLNELRAPIDLLDHLERTGL